MRFKCSQKPFYMCMCLEIHTQTRNVHHIIKILKFEFVGGGGSIDTHFESEVGINLRIWGGSTLILGGGGGGGQLTLTLKVKLGLTCGSGVD